MLMQLTGLVQFWFQDTAICEPTDAAFQAWPEGTSDLQRTNRPCYPNAIYLPMWMRRSRAAM